MHCINKRIATETTSDIIETLNEYRHNGRPIQQSYTHATNSVRLCVCLWAHLLITETVHNFPFDLKFLFVVCGTLRLITIKTN